MALEVVSCIIRRMAQQAYLYLAVRRDNGDSYVGITAQKPERRWQQHCYDATHKNVGKSRFHNALRKYGRDAFDWSVVQTLQDWDSAKAAEIAWIAEHKPALNISLGGDGAQGVKFGPLSEAHKAQISQANRGRIKPESERKNISRGLIGLKKSETHRENLSASHRGKVLSPEHRAKIKSTCQKQSSAVALRNSLRHWTDEMKEAARIRLAKGNALRWERYRNAKRA